MAAVGELITPTGVLVMDAETMRTDRATWLAARRWREMPVPYSYAAGLRIGSSDVPSILGLDGVDTPVHVFHEKYGRYSTPVNEAMTFGQRFEPVIAEMWTERYRTVTDEIGLVARHDAPWHQSTIDRRVCECPTIKGMRNGCGLEIKNVGYSTAERWGREIPDRILAQLAHQAYVTGYHHMHYGIAVGGNTLRSGIVWAEREAELIDYVAREVNRFRDNHLLTGIEPEWNVMDKPDKMLALDREMHPVRAGEIGLDEIGDVMEYARAARTAADAAAELKVAKARLAQLADGAQVVLFGDHEAYRYGGEGAQQTRTRVDVNKLMEKYPEAYADPEVVIETVSPVLRLAREYQIKKAKKARD